MGCPFPIEWRNLWLEKDDRQSQTVRSTNEEVLSFGRFDIGTRKERLYESLRAPPIVKQQIDFFGTAWTRETRADSRLF